MDKEFNKNSKIYISGHKGMVGSAVYKNLKENGFKNILVCNSSELDLINQKEVLNFFKLEKPEIVINCAALVGGILANHKFPFDFLYNNMMIQNNLISSSKSIDVNKFIFLGSSCIYPKFSHQPIKEEELLSGKLEETNEWYAIAKISGIKLIDSINKQFSKKYLSLMPTNLYGDNDNFSFNSSHVIPALIRKFHESKEKNKSNVTLWGSGSVFREFMHVNDLANVIYFFLTKKNLKHSLYNVGSGEELKIIELANLIKNIVGFEGDIIWDRTKPDGTPRKLLDSSRLNKIYKRNYITLEKGIADTYEFFRKNYSYVKK